MENILNINSKKIVVVGDFNGHLDFKLKWQGSKPRLMKQTVAKIIEILEQFDLCDMWQIRSIQI